MKALSTLGRLTILAVLTVASGCGGGSSGARSSGGTGGSALGGATGTETSTGYAGSSGQGTRGGDTHPDTVGGTDNAGGASSVSTGGHTAGGLATDSPANSSSGGATAAVTGGSGGSGSGEVGGMVTGGSGGGGASSVVCPSGLPPGPPWQFCVGNALYEGIGQSCDGGACACVPGRHLNCLEGCVKNANDAGGSCKNRLVPCPPSGYYKPVCFGNALNNVAVGCPAGGSCTCVFSSKQPCPTRCIDLADGSGRCE